MLRPGTGWVERVDNVISPPPHPPLPPACHPLIQLIVIESWRGCIYKCSLCDMIHHAEFYFRRPMLQSHRQYVLTLKLKDCLRLSVLSVLYIPLFRASPAPTLVNYTLVSFSLLCITCDMNKIVFFIAIICLTFIIGFKDFGRSVSKRGSTQYWELWRRNTLTMSP